MTTDERLQRIATSAGGFIYLVSRLGVTGTDKSAGNLTNLGGLISRLKALTKLPICAGFGVSSKQTSSALLELGVDGVIVGSRVIEIARQSEHYESDLAKLFKELHESCCELRSPMDAKK